MKFGMVLRSSGNDTIIYEVIAVGKATVDVAVVGSPESVYLEQDPKIFTLVEDAPIIPRRKEMKIRIREALIAEKFKRLPHIGPTKYAQRYTEVWS